MEGQDSHLGEVVRRVLVRGYGILFTSTRDGGAVGVHLYQGDTRSSDFAASPEDFEALIEALGQLVEEKKGYLAGTGIKAVGIEP